MCGRFTLRDRLNELLQSYSIESHLLWEPRFNIAPSQSIAVVRNDPNGEKRELAALRWGLIPSWAKDIHIGNQLINARAETIASKPSFKQAFKSRRCLVLPNTGRQLA